MSRVDTKLPVLFQKLEEHKVEDTRFVKVKIWLMHTGTNFNYSSFTKNVVENAIPTLANTPILGYIEDNSLGETDLSDHRKDVKKDLDGSYTISNAGVPFGLIPESNNAKFEERLCDDGVVREFLTVEGLLWTKWSDSIDILSRDVVKNQSMELDSDHDGYFDKDGVYHFTRFSFYGACILGIDYEPAMKNSTIELSFNAYDSKDLQAYMQEKMEQFKTYSKAIAEEDERRDVMEEKLNLIADFEKTEEDIVNLGINLEEISFEDLKVRLEDLQEDEKEKEEPETNPGNTEEEEKVDESKVDEVDEPVEDYEKLHAELKAELESAKEELLELREFKAERLAKDRKESEAKLLKEYSILTGIKEYEDIVKDTSRFENVEDLEKEFALVFARNKEKFLTVADEKADTSEGEEVHFGLEVEDKPSQYGGLFEKYGK